MHSSSVPPRYAIFGGMKPELARKQHGVPDGQRNSVGFMVNKFRATGAAWVPPAAVAADGEAEIAGSDPMPTRLEDCTTYREGYKLGGTMVSKKLTTARKAAETLEEHAPKGVNMPGCATLGTAAKNPGVSPVKRGRKDDLPQ